MHYIRRAMLALTACAVSMTTPLVPAHAQEPEGMTLERVVGLMRHGVRPPTKTPPLPDGYAKDAWPKWDVPAGHLTQRGADALVLRGQYNKSDFVERELLSAGCPKTGEVYFWANIEQRTIASGEATAQGMFAGCGVETHHNPLGQQDPLFSAGGAKAVAFDQQKALAAITARFGDVQKIADANIADLKLMQSVLGCCAPPLCDKAKLEASCTFTDLPSTVAMGIRPGARPRLTGPLTVAGTYSQNLLLEYLEGRPMTQVGWGRADRETVETLLRFHALEYEIVSRPPAVSYPLATPLVRRMLDALAPQAKSGAAPRGEKLTMFFGHDNTLALLGGFLGVHWKLASYPGDDSPPNGTLGFELLKNAKGERFVRTFYEAQTMDQIRNLEPLSNDNKPARQYLELPGCNASGDASPCPLRKFQTLLEARLVK
ncbi:phosphoanhydride phosphohydrolase [Sphingomonas sp. LH128]|uniref:histidine-type phosphatase n=1 Tax=Sphingomonas sp. LH128 TaxID=473781 RepID=UPI00027CAAAB|nr:histidine-type phosphatase [Sphingomonas sp. LH128]EJU14574.1 phosphoanhydride phosphohydrolase [Sphingomonas sp. LH128]